VAGFFNFAGAYNHCTRVKNLKKNLINECQRELPVVHTEVSHHAPLLSFATAMPLAQAQTLTFTVLAWCKKYISKQQLR
jgi:hypothetical protein